MFLFPLLFHLLPLFLFFFYFLLFLSEKIWFKIQLSLFHLSAIRVGFRLIPRNIFLICNAMDNRAPQILAVNIVFWVLTWLALSLRVYVRGFLRKTFGIDDWFMVGTQVRNISI